MRVTEGMSQIPPETELGRESLYKALSESANPHFSTVYEVIYNLGFQISIQPAIASSCKLKEVQ